MCVRPCVDFLCLKVKSQGGDDGPPSRKKTNTRAAPETGSDLPKSPSTEEKAGCFLVVFWAVERTGAGSIYI